MHITLVHVRVKPEAVAAFIAAVLGYGARYLNRGGPWLGSAPMGWLPVWHSSSGGDRAFRGRILPAVFAHQAAQEDFGTEGLAE